MSTYPTERQIEVLDLIKESVESRGYPPSLRELAAALKVSGIRAVEKHIAALEKKGMLRRGRGSRAIDVAGRARGLSVPILGQVAAGVPLLAAENIEGHLTLDASMARGEECFLLRVKGQSMKDAGILNGDLVLVRKQPNADSGEIVVALFDDEATIKRLIKRPGSVMLQPENKDFKPIVIRENELQLVGKVVGVFRF